VALDPTVRALADRAAIHDLMLRYARGVDRQDLDVVASCFTPDAAYDGALGRGTIREALEALRRALERYASTMHFIGNVTIELAGDRASSETYAIAYHRLRGDERRQYVVAVRYQDDLVRREGRWLIARRLARRAWERYEPLEGESTG
jgi:uncharacterized protein (TIGR02246 family)